MTLAFPWWLALLALGAVIAALHMRRRRTTPVSSLFLWRRVRMEARTTASTRPPIVTVLLLLQLFVLVLVAVALARPTVTQSRTDHLLLVLDASASMQASDVLPNRFERAKSHALEVARAIERQPEAFKGRLSVVVATSTPYLAAARLTTSGAGVVASALSRSSGTDTRADWEEVATLISSVHLDGEALRIVLLTDGIGVADGLSPVSAAFPRADVGHVLFEGDAVNAGLAGVSLIPNAQSDEWVLSGVVVASAAAEGTTSLRVLFSPSGGDAATILSEIAVELRPGHSSPFSAELSLPSGGIVEVQLPDDHLAFDNAAQFIVHDAPVTLRVLHVGPSNPRLTSALDAVGGLEVAHSAELPTAAGFFDLVIVDRTTVDEHPGTHTLWLSSLLPEWTETRRMLDPTPTGWRNDHPIAASTSWEALRVARASMVPRLPGADVLLEAGDHPLVQVRTTSRGHDVVISFELNDSNWVDSIEFPLFVLGLINWLEPDLGERVASACRVGTPCLRRSFLVHGDVRGPDAAAIAVMPPVGTWSPNAVLGWPDSNRSGAFFPTVAGIFAAYSAERPQARVVVEASDARESALTAAALEPAARNLDAAATIGASSRIRFWLLVSAAVILLFEASLAGRKPERYMRLDLVTKRGPLGRRQRNMVALRVGASGFLGLALAAAPIPFPIREARTVVIIDQPAHLGDHDRGVLLDFIARSEAEGGGRRQIGWIGLGSPPSVASDLGTPAQLEREGGRAGADLEAAVRLALAMAPGPGATRVVLAASSIETTGRVVDVMPLLTERGVPLDVLPLVGVPPGEVLAEFFTGPHSVYADEPALLNGIVFAEAGGRAIVRVSRDGVVVGEQEVILQPGRNRVEFPVRETEPGTHLYELEVAAETDFFDENNRAGVLLTVDRLPRLAIYTPHLQWGEVLAEALKLQGLEPVVLPPNRAPYYLGHESPQVTGWLDWDAAIFLNVPAIDLQHIQQDHLRTWVRDHGGGVVLFGGENTFGPGGYYHTPLEDLLPLSTDIPQERPSVAMTFVVDRSGSMRQAVGEVSRLDVAKRALLAAVELLDEESLVSVIAFDSSAEEVLPMTPAGDQEIIRALLEPIQPGGGTAIYPGLALAFEHMLGIDDDMTRHIVVMTDGLSQPGDFEGILESLSSARITVSTAAIGRGADVRLLETIARMGGGAAHVTSDFEAFPSILAQEALLLSDEPNQQETFVPERGDTVAPFMQYLPGTLPPLHGHTLVSAKPDARVHLFAPNTTPLLASWRYGLGKVAALASDGVGPWAASWVDLADYPRFLAQLIRWSLPEAHASGYHLSVEQHGDRTLLTVDVLDAVGSPREGLTIVVRAAGPDGERVTTLDESLRGRYEGWFKAETSGIHNFEVSVPQVGEGLAETVAQAALYVSYPTRFDFTRSDDHILSFLAAATGGRVLAGDESLFASPVPLTWRWDHGWPLWVLLALALFLIELVYRYAPGLLTSVRLRVSR